MSAWRHSRAARATYYHYMNDKRSQDNTLAETPTIVYCYWLVEVKTADEELQYA